MPRTRQLPAERKAPLIQLSPEVQSSSVSLDSTEIARLRALGYVVPDASIDATGLDPKDGLPFLAEFHDAVTLYAEGDLQGALHRIEPVVDKLPQSPQVHWIYGFVLLGVGEPEKAFHEIQEASRLSPLSARYRAMVGEFHRRRGENETAMQDFEAAAALDPSEPMAQVGLAWASWKRGDAEAAIFHSHEAAREGALEPTIHKLLAELWSEQGRRQEAVAALREALRLRPTWPTARMQLTLELAQLGSVEESETERRALGRAGCQTKYALQLGGLYEQSGATAAAERLYREIIANCPHDPRLPDALARLQAVRQ